MKFKIRFADQIVGVLVLAALAALIFVIFMLGTTQRWFAKDKVYTSLFESATGLSKNMAVQYKGFTVGKIKDFQLTDNDLVKVDFTIFEEYTNRVREGSLVEVVSGLGSQFLFHPGTGIILEENALIPHADSPQGREYIQKGMARTFSGTDSISTLIARANTLLDPRHESGLFSLIGHINATLEDVNKTIVELNSALVGTDATVIGRTLMGAEDVINNAVSSLLSSVDQIAENLADPESTLSKIVDGDGAVYESLESTLSSVSSMLGDLEKITNMLPSQMPQILGVISNLQTTLQAAEDVLTALSNNPLLRKGIPERVHTESSGTSSRDLDF